MFEEWHIGWQQQPATVLVCCNPQQSGAQNASCGQQFGYCHACLGAPAGDSGMEFTAALHTYFAASSIEGISVEGLSGVTYMDSLAGGSKVVQEGPVVFDKEVDRIYLAAPDAAIKVRSMAHAGSMHGTARTVAGLMR